MAWIVELSTEGLRRIEGPFDQLLRDALAGPAQQSASRLLEQVTRAVR